MSAESKSLNPRVAAFVPGQPVTHPPVPRRRYLALDVECIATGSGHNDRAVAQISVVDHDENVVFDAYVLPSAPVHSYLTALTGIDERKLQQHGMPLEDALAQLQALLKPGDAALVGHSLASDIRWLGLTPGTHFTETADLARLWQVWDPAYNNCK